MMNKNWTATKRALLIIGSVMVVRHFWGGSFTVNPDYEWILFVGFGVFILLSIVEDLFSDET